MGFRDRLSNSGELYEQAVSILSLAFRELIEEYYPALHSFDIQKIWNSRLRKVELAKLTPQMWKTLREILATEQKLIGTKIVEILGFLPSTKGEVEVVSKKIDKNVKE